MKHVVYLHKEKLKMKIKNKYLLDKFEKKHADSARALQKFIDIVEDAQWHNLSDIKTDFNSVDYVSNERYVFNIKGNNYRIIAVIIFIADVFTIRFVGTHSEYNKINARKI